MSREPLPDWGWRIVGWTIGAVALAYLFIWVAEGLA